MTITTSWSVLGRSGEGTDMTAAAGPYGDDVSTDEDLWTIAEAAAHCGISAATWQSYVSRGQAPAPDKTYARTPLWRPDAVREWHSQRPGRGWRAGAKGSPSE